MSILLQLWSFSISEIGSNYPLPPQVMGPERNWFFWTSFLLKVLISLVIFQLYSFLLLYFPPVLVPFGHSHFPSLAGAQMKSFAPFWPLVTKTSIMVRDKNWVGSWRIVPSESFRWFFITLLSSSAEILNQLWKNLCRVFPGTGGKVAPP